MAIHIPGVGDVVRSTDVNQYGDVPGTIASGSATSNQTITSGTYAALPTPVSASLVTTHASTLVQVVVTGQWGSGSSGALTAVAYLSAVLSGTVTQAAGDLLAVAGGTPGAWGYSLVQNFIVAAGTLTATLEARVGASQTLRAAYVQIIAVRPV